MKQIYIIVPNWKEDANTECLLIEYNDQTAESANSSVQVLYVDQEEYQLLCEMVKLIYDERRLSEPQNTLPV